MVSRSRHYLAAALAALILPSGLSAVEAAASPADLRAGPRSAANADLTVGNATLTEAAANLSFKLTLSQRPTSEVFVFYETVDRTAEAGADFRTKYGWLGFSTTQRTKTVRVPVLDDAAGEATERMTLKVTAITGPVTIADGTGVGTIKDADPNHLVVRVVSDGPTSPLARPYVSLEPGGHECDAQTACDLTVPDGTAVTLTAHDYFSGFGSHTFRHWDGNGCPAFSDTCSLTVASDIDTTAHYHHQTFGFPRSLGPRRDRPDPS